jgi:hypothetical protein
MRLTDALGQLKGRADKIGVSLKVLAREAGMDPGGLYRAAKPGADYRQSTPARLLKVLEPRETEILRHLVRLFPQMAARLAQEELERLAQLAKQPDHRQLDLEDMPAARAGGAA